MKKRNLLTFILVIIAMLNVLHAQTVQGSFESPYSRYQKGEQFAGMPMLTENLCVWKTERAYTQIIIWSQANQSNLSYQISDLKTSASDYIPAEAIQLLFAKNVMADRYARNCGTYRQPRMEFVEIADALSFTPVTEITVDDPLKIWVRVNIPGNIPAGVYSGTITIKQNNTVQLRFNLNVEVLNKTLPDMKDWSFHLDLWQYPYQLVKFYNEFHEIPIQPWSENHFNMITPFYQVLADAGQKVVTTYITDDVQRQPSMVKWILKTDNTWEYDFTIMDKWIDLLTSMGVSKQISCFSSIGMDIDYLTYYDEASSSSNRLNAPMFSTVYYERWNDFLTALKIHLKNRNLFDKTVIYLDEVENELLPQLDSLIHGNDPDWKIGYAYFRPLSETESNMMYDISGNLGAAQIAGREDRVTTFYTSCAQTIPNTYVTLENSPAESTWMVWHTANKNLNGVLRWAYDYWTLTDPLNIQDEYITSGDFSIIYRSSNDIDAEVYTSYRLELFRKGIQDFEKIKILKYELGQSNKDSDLAALGLINEKIAQFHENSGTGAKRLVEEGSRLLNDVVRGNYSYCTISGTESGSAYTQWFSVTGSITPLGNTWAGSYPGGYSYYTDGKITAYAGDTLTLTIENSPESHCARTSVWIDWNKDYNFDGQGDNVWNGGIANSCDNVTSNTIKVVIPGGTKPGVKRMRIQVRDAYMDIPHPCGEVSWSSTRDFDIEVADRYCQSLTHYNKMYFLRKAISSNCTGNLNFKNDVMPPLGYEFDATKMMIAEKGTSFLLDIENSELSKCARTAIWIDWNRNNIFEDNELIALKGEASTCDNLLNYRIPVTVPTDAKAGHARMRIQLRDSYQEVPQSCLMDNVTGTTDFILDVVEASGGNCSPIVTFPYNGELLSDSTVTFTWSSNNNRIDQWKLKITNADSDKNQPVYFEQHLEAATTSVQVSGLPHFGENLSVELSWKTSEKWYSATTYNKAMDLYCLSAGASNASYFIHELSSNLAANNISYLSGDAPEYGYYRMKNSAISVTPGSSFTLDIVESAASSCAYTAVWIDWNEDGIFADSEKVYASGKPNFCKNETKHKISIEVPENVQAGTKRLRIKLSNSWLPAVGSCGGGYNVTTYDIDVEVTFTTGIPEEKEQKQDLKIFVLADQLYIYRGEKTDLPDNTKVRLYSIDGRLIKLFNNFSNPAYIGNVANGIYIVSVKSPDRKYHSSKISIRNY